MHIFRIDQKNEPDQPQTSCGHFLCAGPIRLVASAVLISLILLGSMLLMPRVFGGTSANAANVKVASLRSDCRRLVRLKKALPRRCRRLREFRQNKRATRRYKQRKRPRVIYNRRPKATKIVKPRSRPKPTVQRPKPALSKGTIKKSSTKDRAKVKQKPVRKPASTSRPTVLPAPTARPNPSPPLIADAVVTADPVTATRMFARRGEIPQSNFRAYGILAFRTAALNNTQKLERYTMICNAFKAVLPSTDEVDTAPQDQMVTVWPLEAVDDETFSSIRFGSLDGTSGCELAVRNYSLPIAKAAVRHARKAGAKIKGRGPYLFAWAPPEKKGDAAAVVLQMDMSKINTLEQAEELLLTWAEKIEGDPDLWKNGWNVESVRLAIKLFVDKFGDKVVTLVKK